MKVYLRTREGFTMLVRGCTSIEWAATILADTGRLYVTYAGQHRAFVPREQIQMVWEEPE